jgi:transcriptional regulator with XRE-family HTH domain
LGEAVSVTRDKRWARLGHFLRSWRLDEGLAQNDLARLLDIHPSHLADVEAGRRGWTRWDDLAAILGVPRRKLLKLAGCCLKCSGTGIQPAKS